MRRTALVSSALALAVAVAAAPFARATWSICLTDTSTGEVAIGTVTCINNADLEKFVVDKKCTNVREIVGAALPYFSTHASLVESQRKAKVSRAGEGRRDDEWSGDKIREQTAALMTD